MANEMAKSSKSIWPMVIVAVVLIAAGAVAGYLGAGKCGATGGDKGYQAGWDAARQKIADAHVFPQAASINSVSGTVVSVSGEELVMDATQVVTNPLEPQAPTRRTVKVTSTTKIISQIAKTAEQLQSDQEKFNDEMDKFNADLRAGKTGLTPPVPPNTFETKDIKLADIAVGSQVMVTAASDITMAESFDAISISVSSATSAAATPLIPGGAGAIPPSPAGTTPEQPTPSPVPPPAPAPAPTPVYP